MTSTNVLGLSASRRAPTTKTAAARRMDTRRPKRSRQYAGGQRARHGTEGHPTGDDLNDERAGMEGLVDPGQCARNDTLVVPEQQPGQHHDEADRKQVPAHVRAGAGLPVAPAGAATFGSPGAVTVPPPPVSSSPSLPQRDEDATPLSSSCWHAGPDCWRTFRCCATADAGHARRRDHYPFEWALCQAVVGGDRRRSQHRLRQRRQRGQRRPGHPRNRSTPGPDRRSRRHRADSVGPAVAGTRRCHREGEHDLSASAVGRARASPATALNSRATWSPSSSSPSSGWCTTASSGACAGTARDWPGATSASCSR